MIATVNGTRQTLAPGATVADVVETLGGAARSGIAVAVNGAVVPRSAWPITQLDDGDAVEVLSAIGGG